MNVTAKRLAVLKSAVGKSEPEIRNIIGSCYKEEIGAVMLRLYSSSQAFNEGVSDYLRNGKKQRRYSPGCQYQDHIYYGSGYSSAKLAVAIHGKDTVSASL
jgi:hypothetical protein